MNFKENQLMNELNFCTAVLDWNRSQKNPPIEITKEYFVACELFKLHSNLQHKQEPVAKFDDPQVQVVYEILCNDEAPPKGEHWEGFIARRIVDALAQSANPQTPDDLLRQSEQEGWRWAKECEAEVKRLKELAKPEQEPCGWQFFQDGMWHNGSMLNNHRQNTEDAGYPVRDVYPPSARKEWVGLTMEERQYLNDVLNLNGRFTIIHAIEAKLKEKNT